MLKKNQNTLLSSLTNFYKIRCILMLHHNCTYIKTFLFIVSIMFVLQNNYAQPVNKKIDSLKNIIKTRKNIHEQLDILNQISALYNKVNLDSALNYSNTAMQIIRTKNVYNSVATVYYERGIIFKNKGLIDSAQYYLFKALKTFEEKNDIENIIKSNIAIGEFYRSAHSLEDALKFIKRSIRLSKEKHLYIYLPSAYNRMGATIFELAFNNKIPYLDQGYLYKAIQYVDTSFLWSKRNNTNKYDISNYNIIGACHQNLLNYSLAITFYEKALNSADLTGEIIEKPIIYNNLGSNYGKLKNYNKALYYGLIGYKLADSLGIRNNMIYTALSLSVTYNDLKDYQRALEYLQRSDSIKRIVYDENFMSKIKEFEAKYESQRKQLEITQLAKEKELQSAEVKKQRIIIYALILIFVLITISLIIIYRLFIQKKNAAFIISNKNETLEEAYREINNQNEKIKSQNKEIIIANNRLQEFNSELEKRVYERTIELKEKSDEVKAQNEIYKQINEELKIAKEKSEENDRLKTAFLTNMSHEIRTPLNGILGFSKLLYNQDTSNEEKQHFIEIIDNSGQQLITLIDDIIDMAKIEVNQVTLVYKTINLNLLFNEIYTLFKSKAESTGIEFSVFQALDFNQSNIITDGSRVRQVLINLIHNAFKFTQNGFIKFGYNIKNNFVEIYVKDSGIGIAQDKHEIIFDRFRQAEINTSQTYGGTGLGLSISKSLIQILGGTIWVESELKKGSAFFFTIPLDRTVENKPVHEIKADNEFIIKNNKTILIAEDEINNFMLLSAILTNFNVHVIHAKNGQEALDIISSNANISLVLMDIKMPVKSGFEAILELRKTNKYLPVIAQTAFALAGDKEKAIEYGFNEYITKPINIKLLTHLIQKYTKD